MGGETDIGEKVKSGEKQLQKKMRTSVKNVSKSIWVCVCPFHPLQMLTGCTNPSMIAVQYLQNLHLNNLYTLYNNWRQNYSFYKKQSAQWHSKWQCKLCQTSQSCSLQAKTPFRAEVGPQSHASLSFLLPCSHFDLCFIDFHFLYISCIQYSVSGLLSVSFFLTRRYCFALSLRSFLWFGSVQNRRRFLDCMLQACVILAL